MGTPINLGGQSICLRGNQRIVCSAIDTTPGVTYNQISLLFTLSNTGTDRILPPIWQGLMPEVTSQTNPTGDNVTFFADFGSYLVRPPGKVQVVIPAGRSFTGNIFSTTDVCNIPQTFWFTQRVEAGAFVMPPYYHRIKVVAGTFAMAGVNLNTGVDFSIVQGARYSGISAVSLIQLGIDL